MLIFLIVAVVVGVSAYFACNYLKSRGKDESLGGPYQIQAVATDHEECSKIANETLNSNGSAVDAAIAAVFCLGVINMHSSGVGGGGVMLVYSRKLKKAKVIDFRETAPEATTLQMFLPNKTGEDMAEHGLCSFSFFSGVLRSIIRRAQGRRVLSSPPASFALIIVLFSGETYAHQDKAAHV